VTVDSTVSPTVPDATDAAGVPDVSVIIPVYNTLPYLRPCVQSVLTQSIGADRLEIIAVDDGSTDGSGELLDEFAAAHPGTLRVIRHEDNSGGPAAPCNRGLECATGRWVFFLGADDYLSPTALERLVSRGDEWQSDVIFGTMQGENGRFVDQRIYRRTAKDVDLGGSALCYSLSNTKLFRRALLEQHQIRYALDLRVGSDQPFTVEALAQASRISVLTEQVYYYAVKRDDATNITYSTPWHTRLADVTAIIEHIAAVLPPGPVRDAILTRHFTMELGKLVRLDLPGLPAAEQRQLSSGIQQLVTQFWTPGLQQRMGVLARLRIELVASDQLDLLQQVLDYHAACVDRGDSPPLVLRAGTAYVWYPGFDQPTTEPSWYELHSENLSKRLRTAAQVSRAAFSGHSLRLEGRLGVTADSGPCARVVLRPTPPGAKPAPVRRLLDAGFTDPTAETTAGWSSLELSTERAGDGATFRTVLDLSAVLKSLGDSAQDHSVEVQLLVGRHRYDVPAIAEITGDLTSEAVIGPIHRSTVARLHSGGSLDPLILTVCRRPVSRAVKAVVRRALSKGTK